MPASSWSVRVIFWFESWADSAGPISAVLLNELCVPIQGALRRGRVEPSSYWSARAGWIQSGVWAVALGAPAAKVAIAIASAALNRISRAYGALRSCAPVPVQNVTLAAPTSAKGG